jgi:hypothetical protein
MDPARPLHSVFAELAGERGTSGLGPDEVLAAGGHADLPAGLVAEAVVNYADTAPVEVAEHLAPYVRANSAVPQAGGPAAIEEPHWYDLLTTAPPVAELAGTDLLDAATGAPPTTDDGAPATATIDHGDIDLDFGLGHRGPAGAEPGDAGESADPTSSWSATTEPAATDAASPDLAAADPALDGDPGFVMEHDIDPEDDTDSLDDVG